MAQVFYVDVLGFYIVPSFNKIFIINLMVDVAAASMPGRNGRTLLHLRMFARVFAVISYVQSAIKLPEYHAFFRLSLLDEFQGCWFYFLHFCKKITIFDVIHKTKIQSFGALFLHVGRGYSTFMQTIKNSLNQKAVISNV